ncbi:MAG: choice-of-anchor L domain-containing protein [Bacteroidia bacterium]|nr:choice-of-anchor L domain-containing protein [Bacteroidia bacterium]
MRILRISFVVLSFLLAGNIFGQLVVTNTGMTPQQLVQNILVGGGVTVTNVTFLGQLPQQIGRFSTGVNPTNLGMTTGIILSSGDVTLAPGPNNSASSGANTSSGSDPDLEMLIPGYSVNDKGVLEFDFIPLSDTIRFNYIFASEEYPEFVNTSFNDVFGFFLSGPGITGPYSNNAVNIAIIPGTALPVTIDNVNMGNFSCGGSPTGCTNCVYYVNNCGGATIQYDGFTTKLTAWRIVQPCQVYHIKIAVADAGDSAYDSAVFLEAGSFISNGITSQVTYTSTIDTTAIRGCSQGLVTFSIPEQLSTNTVINYQIGGTAQNGVDYTTIGNSVIIPAGQTTGTILINPLIGTGNAPIETVYIITSVSPCQSDTIKIYIRDYQPVVLTASNDTAICQGASAPIHVNVTGGITPYTYAWSGGGNTSNITVTPSSTTMYTVTVNDACQSYNEYVNITVNLNPTTPFTAPPVCASVEPGAINLATITWTGTAEAGATYTWSLSGNPQPQSIFSGPGPINNVYWIWDNTPNTNYYNITLTITNPSGCTSTTTNQIAVVPANNPNCCIPPTLNAGPDISVCGYNYTFNASISGGSIGTWSQLSGAGTSSFSDEHNTTAIVTVTTFGQYTFHWYGESGACNSSDDIVVNFLQYPNPVAGIDELICGTSYTLQGNLPGGMTGTWTCTSPGVNFSNIHAANSSVTVPVPGEYQFVWTLDNTVCSAEDAVTINFFAIPNPNAGPDATVCGNTVNLTGTPNGTTFLGQWTGPNGTLYTPNDTTPNVTAMILPFTVQQNITFQWHQSNEHCSDSDAVVITFNPYAGPGQVSAGFHGYTCDSTIQLHGIIQGVVGTGQWSTTFSNVIIADNLDANTYISINPSTTNYGDSSQYTVTMLWTVSNGNCVARDSVNVTFYETPNASAGKDVAFCGLSGYLPGRFTISAHAGEWTLLIPPAPGCSNTYFSDNTDPTTAIQVSCYGVYTFMWRERNLYNNLCSTTDTVQIEFVELPTISGGDDQWVCGDTVYLHALPSGSSAGQTWSTSPVTWYNSITHQADTTAQQDPVTIAQHYHTFNDTVNFVWQ